MPQLLHTLYAFVSSNQNQFASGGILLMAIGAVGAYLRKVPTTIWNWFLKRCTLSVTVTEQSKDIQSSIQFWLDTHPAFKRNRRIDARESRVRGGATAIVLSLSEGTHWFFYEGFPIRITFQRSEETKSYGDDRPEKLTIQMPGRNKQRIKNFLERLKKDYEAFYEGKKGFFVYKDDYWQRAGEVPERSLDSVVLDGDVKDVILRDVKKFFVSEEWYKHTNIPYHRGYLLHGLPGTGKTSLITAIANDLKINVYQINLNSSNDERMVEAMNSVDPNSIVLFEDIDCAFGKRKAEDEPEKDQPKSDKPDDKLFGVTLSGFLNAIDGLMAPRGIIMFMTTNHIEQLDPAMIRPGRCDVHVEFKEITDTQKVGLYRRFFPDDYDDVVFKFAHDSIARTPAEFQEALMFERSRRDSNTELTAA